MTTGVALTGGVFCFAIISDETAEDIARAAQNLRGNQMEQRMYQATEAIEKHTKRTAELLKDFGGGGATMSFK